MKSRLLVKVAKNNPNFIRVERMHWRPAVLERYGSVPLARFVFNNVKEVIY